MVEIKHKTFGAGGHQPEEKKMDVADLRSLIELGCVRDSVTIGNMTFELRSLSAVENMEAAKFLGENPDAEKVFELNVLLLSMAIESVNGTPLESLYEGEQTPNVLVARQSVIRQLHGSVLGALMKCHHDISTKANSQFSGEQVKN